MNNFDRAAARIQQAINNDGPTRENVIDATTAYLLACDRHDMHHHLEDHPWTCSWETEPEDGVLQSAAQAYDLLWKLIGDGKPDSAPWNQHDPYVLAWEVWGVLGSPGEDMEEFSMSNK